MMENFEFTEAELKSNKKGMLSPRQKDQLNAMAHGIRRSSKSGVWIILGFMFLGLSIIGALFLQDFDIKRLQILGPQILVGLGFTVFAVLGMIALSLFLSNRQSAKLESAQVLAVEGVVQHDSEYSMESSFTSYYVYFGKKRFAYADDMSSTFPEGARFRVYYCKAGQIELIMSFERLA